MSRQRKHSHAARPKGRPSLEELEHRCVPSVTGFRPINEVGNNVANPTWGTGGADLIRLTPAEYADGIDTPSLPQDPSARLISDLLNNQADPANAAQDIATVNQQSLSDFVYSFGQFMDHDMDLTLDNGVSDPIAVPVGDPIGGSSDTPLAFNRTQPDPSTGTSVSNPAQDANTITSYLDLSQVYGSDLATDNALRTFSGGLMKTSPGGLPPLDNSTYFTAAQLAAINASVGGMEDDGPLPEAEMFVTGDSRGNENIELTVLQTLFLDNHNRIASELHTENPTWTDEQIFQEARKLNIAQYQSIIYNEWIPAVLGPKALSTYKGYNPNVNATISNEFSTVAFRFGHSLLSPDVERQGMNGLAVASDIPLADDYFDPTILNGQGQASTIDPVTGLATTSIGAVLKGDADGDAQAEDTQVINEVRDLLFNEVVPGVGGGQDLVALDIERGRDHGIGSYNQVRVGLGLPAVTSFAQITSNVQVQQELQEAYGNVNNIDAIEGGLAEDPVPGSDVGPLFQTILVDQFTALRDGDRYFYLNESFTPQELRILQQGNTLAKVIETNTGLTNLQSNVFLFQASISGKVSLAPGGVPKGIAQPSLAGITIQLEDTSGDVLATTLTNKQGQYTFNQFSGPAANPDYASGVSGTGTYQIVPILQSSLQQVSPSPSSVLISRGGMSVSNVNFVVADNLSSAAFLQTNLASDLGNTAANTDTNLINPWGLAYSPSGEWWAADMGTGLSTVYDQTGTPLSTVVTVPSATDGSLGSPTGIVFNSASSGFTVTEGSTSGPSVMLFATLDGTICGWNPDVDATNAIVEVSKTGASYDGLALDTDSLGRNLLYAADLETGKIDVYTSTFAATTVPGGFVNTNIPASYAPFNIQNLGGLLYVAYAKKSSPSSTVDDPAVGNGFIDVFNSDGVLQQRLVQHGQLDSPWGLALAPSNFGAYSNDLLVGNNGNGEINAYNPHTGAFVGTMKDGQGNPISINSLWAIKFGNGGAAGPTNTLFFAAGINNCADGLFGSLQAISTLPTHSSILTQLSTAAMQSFSTVPPNGDLNPYGVAFVPENVATGGLLAPGDILVSNFNSSSNIQGTGTTIVKIGPDGQSSVFFQASSSQIGLSTALSVLSSGYVIVGNVPNNNGTVGQGSLLILDKNGNLVMTLSDPNLLDGPWDMTVHDMGATAQVFVANVLSGTITRIDLSFSKSGPTIKSMTQIASGYTNRPDASALVVGPTGLAYNAATDTLYVASTGDNAIFSIAHAITTTDKGKGRQLNMSPLPLHGPVGLLLAPNGNLILSNGDAVNPDPNNPNLLVEFTPAGNLVESYQLDAGPGGGAFGIAVSSSNGEIRFAAVDDNTNTLDVWTFWTSTLVPLTQPDDPGGRGR